MFTGLWVVCVIYGLSLRIYCDGLRAKSGADDHGECAIIAITGHVSDRDHRAQKNGQNHQGDGQHFDPVLGRRRKCHGAKNIGLTCGMQKRKYYYNSVP